MKKFDMKIKKKCVLIGALNTLLALLIGLFFAPWYIWLYFAISAVLTICITRKKSSEQIALEKMIKESKRET